METRKQMELLENHSALIDKGLAASVDKLAHFLHELGDGAEQLQEAVDDLKTTITSRAAHQAMAESGA